MFVLSGALLLTVALLVAVYTRPPTRSAVALRRRLDELEELADRTHVELKRLIKRYRSLEGHVYGSFDEPDEPDEEVAPTAAPQAAPAAGGPTLVPDAPDVPQDFPEEAFQQLVNARRMRPYG